MVVLLTDFLTFLCHISLATSLVYLFDFKVCYNSKRKRASALMRNDNNDKKSLRLYL
jgi:hypothetical protein